MVEVKMGDEDRLDVLGAPPVTLELLTHILLGPLGDRLGENVSGALVHLANVPEPAVHQAGPRGALDEPDQQREFVALRGVTIGEHVMAGDDAASIAEGGQGMHAVGLRRLAVQTCNLCRLLGRVQYVAEDGEW